MKTRLIDFLKGIIIGIGSIAPGLSGGAVAVVLNVYDKLIEGVKDLLTHPIRVIKELWPLLLGVVLGLLVGLLVIIKLVVLFPLATMLLFVGFIIGPIPTLYGEVKEEKKTKADYLTFFIIIAVIIGLSFVRGSQGSYTVIHPLILFFIGIIAVATMIIPGVSGTTVLMIIGAFTYLVGEINLLIDNILVFNFSNILSIGFGLLPFALGILLGGVLLAKLISMLFRKYQKTMKIAVVAFLVSCPVAIASAMISEYGSTMKNDLLINIIVGILLLVIGTISSSWMAKLEKKNDQM